MTTGELLEHLGYVTDTVKVSAYLQALRQVITPKSVVLDLGCGTGLLGLLACQAGAQRVYAVDNGPILGAARSTAIRNGFENRIVHVRGTSTELRLPEPVDVVVSDQIGGIAQDAGVLRYHADARARLCAPGAVFLPGSFQLRAAPVSSTRLGRHVFGWRRSPPGLDFGEFADLATHTVYCDEGAASWLLGDAAPFAQVDSDRDGPITGSVTVEVQRAATMHAVRGTFVAHLTDTVSLTNEPGSAHSFRRWQNYYPLDKPVNVQAGDLVEFRIDVRPKVDVTTWWITVMRGPRCVHHCRRSTALGALLDTVELRALDRGRTPLLAPGLVTLLQAVDGSTSVAQLEQLALHNALAISPEGAKDLVQRLLLLSPNIATNEQ